MPAERPPYNFRAVALPLLLLYSHSRRVSRRAAGGKGPEAMAKDTLTLALIGDIDFRSFAETTQHFRALIEALSEEMAPGVHIEWTLHDLGIGSAITAVRGESDRIDRVEQVVRAYAEVGRALEHNKPMPFSERVSKEAYAITRVLNHRIRSIRFETPDEDIIIAAPLGAIPEVQLSHSYGAVKGRVETLSRRKGLRFILYEALTDKAVPCYVTEEKEQLLRDIWGKRVLVEGRVTRDPISGRPFTIRDVTNITPLAESTRKGYLEARGAIPLKLGMISPEEAVRRIRDA